jgi:hypothetical protein
MPIAVCDDLLRPAKYRNYHQRIESGERAPAEAESHSDREMVGAKLYPAFHPHIQYAALSPDGRGLKNYGAVALRWQVTPFYLERRISLLDENSFTFFERYNLGALRTPIPPGHQSVWADRTKLTIAKLAARLNSATSESSLPMLLLHSAGNRDDDDFLEVAIYAEGGLDTKDVDLVSLQTSPTTPEDQRRWQLILEMCSARAIKVLS